MTKEMFLYLALQFYNENGKDIELKKLILPIQNYLTEVKTELENRNMLTNGILTPKGISFANVSPKELDNIELNRKIMAFLNEFTKRKNSSIMKSLSHWDDFVILKLAQMIASDPRIQKAIQMEQEQEEEQVVTSFSDVEVGEIVAQTEVTEQPAISVQKKSRKKTV